MVKKILNLSFGYSLNSFFSNSLNHDVAKWTFFNITQEPFLTLELIAWSACSNPSGLPIATDVNLTPVSLESYSTLNEGSNPGAEHNKMGVLDADSFSTTCFISTVYPSKNPSPKIKLINLFIITLNLSGLNILIICKSLIYLVSYY